MPQTLVIVEDDSAIASLLCDLLNKQRGYQAARVSNCAAALGLLSDVQVDGIILGNYQPGWSAVDFCAHLQQEAGWAAIPILVITEHPDQISEASPSGCAILVRPFTLDAFLQAVDALRPSGPPTSVTRGAAPPPA